MEKLKSRIDWVDYAKGICIVLVVLMHSTLGVEKAAGQFSALHGFIDWARPFRMPDFFLISGLFLASRINKPWRTYLDTKVLHFAYFYVLWMSLQFLVRGPGIYQAEGASAVAYHYLMGFIEPFGTLWFIYMLAVFFPVTKLLSRLPAPLVFIAAALLETAAQTGLIHTGFTLVDEFAGRFVYFYAGFWLAKNVFSFADRIDQLKPQQIFSGLAVWGLVNYAGVAYGLSTMAGFSLIMGFMGAGAVIATGVLLSKFKLAEALRYCGTNSIVIYLAFFLFMAATRTLLLRFAPMLGLEAIAVLTTAAGVLGPLALFRAVKGTSTNFLFSRPQWAKLVQTDGQWHSAAYVLRIQNVLKPQTR